ncbi:MAG: winged helix-turn-helix domain-containing protein [Tannerella sp.]|jgi:hypothetical protein|nr:winged helix-turn-helix domain-containing protein [Tannerella sp.]
MLEKDIRRLAGEIYSLLCAEGKITLDKLEKFAYDKNYLMLSLGWLLREDRLIVYRGSEDWYFEVKGAYQEYYY